MAYLNVAKNTQDRLILCKSPGIYCVAVAAVIFVILLLVIGQPQGFDTVWWTPVSVIGCFLASLTTVNSWEKCDFCKKSKTLKLIRHSLHRKVFRKSPSTVVIQLEDITDVFVEEFPLKYLRTTTCIVALSNAEGHLYYLTENATTDDGSQHEEICQIVRNFLNIQESKKDD